MPDTIRINKYLAHAVGLSRREADAAVQAGRVTVNGQKAVLGAAVSPGSIVTLDGRPIAVQNTYTYLALNKPVGYLCSRRSQGGVPTIYELLPEALRPLKPVGRLDKDSSGLLLLTNDGDFAHRMTHPSFYKTKVYDVELDHALEPLHQQMISDHGIQLEDGVSKFIVESVSDTDKQTFRVTMHEGRNRQIRRTFAALGYVVTRLHRTTFGPYTLNDLQSGTYSQTNRR